MLSKWLPMVKPVAIPLLCVTMPLFIFQHKLAAQGTRAMTSVERRVETMDRQAKDFERDNMASDGKSKKDPQIAKRNREVKLEIEEDLKSLQAAYNSMVTALQANVEYQAGSLSDAFRIVKKTALRLQTNLVLPADADGDAEKNSPPTPVRTSSERKAVSLLCRSIYDFVTNPIFESPASLDIKNGPKARRDLDTIIILSTDLADGTRPTTK